MGSIPTDFMLVFLERARWEEDTMTSFIIVYS